MSEQPQIRLATEEDLERDFGPGKFTIGLRVRPTRDGTPPPPAEPAAEEEDS